MCCVGIGHHFTFTRLLSGIISHLHTFPIKAADSNG
jgi:hypothetical protein